MSRILGASSMSNQHHGDCLLVADRQSKQLRRREAAKAASLNALQRLLLMIVAVLE